MMKLGLLVSLVTALAACSSGQGDEIIESTQPACVPYPAACVVIAPTDEAKANARWDGLRCQADAAPNVPLLPIGDAGGFYGCTGTWTIPYDVSNPWDWCCPEALGSDVP